MNFRKLYKKWTGFILSAILAFTFIVPTTIESIAEKQRPSISASTRDSLLTIKEVTRNPYYYKISFNEEINFFENDYFDYEEGLSHYFDVVVNGVMYYHAEDSYHFNEPAQYTICDYCDDPCALELPISAFKEGKNEVLIVGEDIETYYYCDIDGNEYKKLRTPDFDNALFVDEENNESFKKGFYEITFSNDNNISSEAIGDYLTLVKSVTVNGIEAKKELTYIKSDGTYNHDGMLLLIDAKDFKLGKNKVLIKAEKYYDDLEFNVDMKMADKYAPKKKDISVLYNDSLNPADLIENTGSLPDETRIAFKEQIDTTKLGVNNVTIKVTYKDGSSEEVTGKLTVNKRKAPKLNKPRYIQGDIILNSYYEFSLVEETYGNMFLENLDFAYLNNEKIDIKKKNKKITFNSLPVNTGINTLNLISYGFEDLEVTFEGLSEADRIKGIMKNEKDNLNLESLLNYEALKDMPPVKEALLKATEGIDNAIDTEKLNGSESYAVISKASEDGKKTVKEAVDKTFLNLKKEKEEEIKKVCLTEDDIKNKTLESIAAGKKKLEEQVEEALMAVNKAETVKELEEVIVPSKDEAITLLKEKELKEEDKKEIEEKETKEENIKVKKEIDSVNKAVKTGDDLIKPLIILGVIVVVSAVGYIIVRNKRKKK